MRNLQTEHSHLHDSRHTPSLTRKRRTLGNADDLDDRSWDISSIKHSLQASGHKPFIINPDYPKLVEENEKLRKEVQRLQYLVTQSVRSEKDLERMGSAVWNRKEDKSPDKSSGDVNKMKKIIEKSYYSIKEMEKEISELTHEVNTTKKDCQRLTKKLQFCEIQREDLINKLENLKASHKKEIWMCNQRVRKLENQVEQLIMISDHDQKEWRDQINKMLEQKGFSISRTHYK